MPPFLRRMIALLLALSLMPALAGGALCAQQHQAGVSHGSEQSHGAEHAHGAGDAQGALLAGGTAHVHSTHGASSEQTLPSVQAHDQPDCCPPASVPVDCRDAMGCSAVSRLPDGHALVASVYSSSVAFFHHSALPPGPSRAPDVPPPRA